MARLNRLFQVKFSEWLEKRFGGSAQAAAFEANLVVSPAALGNWRRGQAPSEKKVRDFFSELGEDPEPWLALLNDQRRAA